MNFTTVIYKLYYEGLEVLSKSMQIYLADNFKNIIRKTPQVSIGVKLNNDLLNLTIDT